MSRSSSSHPEVGSFALPGPTTESQSVIKYIELQKTNRRVKRFPEVDDSLFSYQNITLQQIENMPKDATYRSLLRAGGTVSFALNQLDAGRLAANESYSEYGMQLLQFYVIITSLE